MKSISDDCRFSMKATATGTITFDQIMPGVKGGPPAGKMTNYIYVMNGHTYSGIGETGRLGDAIRVYYDPDRPWRSVLELPDVRMSKMMSALALSFFGIRRLLR